MSATPPAANLGVVRLKQYRAAVAAMVAALACITLATVTLGSGRNQLRFIVQQQCLPHWQSVNDPAPCVSVRLVGDSLAADGFAVLADQKGGAHYLLIPTRTISGIESPDVLSPSSVNYFDAAWKARDVLASAVGHSVPREAVGMAVNQIHARSQDQLHIHISCLGRPVYETLQMHAEDIGTSWTPLGIDGWQYQAMRLVGAQLEAANPFALLAEHLPGAKDSMGAFTVLVAGMQFREGPGFAILAGTRVPGAEMLLDSTCAVASATK